MYYLDFYLKSKRNRISYGNIFFSNSDQKWCCTENSKEDVFYRKMKQGDQNVYAHITTIPRGRGKISFGALSTNPNFFVCSIIAKERGGLCLKKSSLAEKLYSGYKMPQNHADRALI